jgi:hypothetical protein
VWSTDRSSNNQKSASGIRQSVNKRPYLPVSIVEVSDGEGFVNRFRLGIEGNQGQRELNLRALFAAFDIPWDEEKSHEIFEGMLTRLEEREGDPPRRDDDRRE